MIIEVRIVLENKKLKEHGIDEEIVVSGAIDLNDVTAMRQALDDDGNLLQDECYIYMHNDVFCIKANYPEILDSWKKLKSRNLLTVLQ